MRNLESELQNKTKNQDGFGKFPSWVDNLFFRFSLIYKGFWTHNLKSDADILANQIEWYFPLQHFAGDVIGRAIDQCKVIYDQPPSIKQFVELCRQERDRYNFHNLQLTCDEKSSPCSPLLQEYMLRNPRAPDDPFKAIFAKYKGKQRGIETMKEINRQLRDKIK